MPFTEQISAAEIITTGEFSGPACILTDDTIYRLRSMGFETEYSKHIASTAITGVDDCLSLSEGSLLCTDDYNTLD